MCKVNKFFADSGRFWLSAYNFLNNFKIEEAFFSSMVGEIVKNSLILHLEIRVSPNADTDTTKLFHTGPIASVRPTDAGRRGGRTRKQGQ